jgi:hypothetical protein
MEMTKIGPAWGEPSDSEVARKIAEELVAGERLPDTEVFTRLGLEDLTVGGNAPANLAVFTILEHHLLPEYRLTWRNAMAADGHYSVYRLAGDVE